VSLDDWILALHVLSAFAYVAGVVLFWVLVVAVRRTDTPEDTIRMEPMVKVGNASVGIGATGTIVLGIWLALSYGGYELWDGWIVAAIVLWVASAATGSRTGAEYLKGMRRAQELQSSGRTGPDLELLALNGTQRGLLLHALTSTIVLVILVDMIWKPGA
jgi:uncharacterized membrane protein